MQTEVRYTVMKDYGDGANIHIDDLDIDEATSLVESLSKDFPESLWWIERYNHIVEEERHYNEYACDGWGDIYPFDDY